MTKNNFLKNFGQILGLEKCAEAVEDAKQNAELNKVTNAEFFTGTAEHILSAVFHRATKSNIIAVVDPPRAGLGRLKKKKQMRYVHFNSIFSFWGLVLFQEKSPSLFPTFKNRNFQIHSNEKSLQISHS